MRDLDLVLGTQLKVRLLRALAQLGTPVSARHASRLAGVSAKGARTLDELAQVGILEKRETPSQHLYRFRGDHYLAEPLRALFAAEERKLRQLAALIADVLSSARGVIAGAIFGSSARGEAGPGSDLDLLILVGEEEAADDVLNRLLDLSPELSGRFGARLSPLVLAVAEWRARAAAGDPLVSRVAQEAILIAGDPDVLRE